MTDQADAPVNLQERLQQALRGTYSIERELGGGGMSIVFAAQELELHRKVVIKVLPPALEAEMSTERFRREIRLAIDLQHPNIVPVLTAGQVDGLTYYVMPFVKGESLEQRLEKGPLTTGQTVQILRDVARALAYAHEHGVVHRDIKPGNIMLTGGAAVVTDFGIAKALSSSREVRGRSLTSIGMAVGTPSYMAPEQAAADPNTDARADLYALGVTAYEMLTGITPFHHRTKHELLVAHLTEQPAPLATRVSGVPPALVELVDQCLSKAPGDRPASAAEVLSRLDAIPLSGRFPALRVPGTTQSLMVTIAGLFLVILVGAAFWMRGQAAATARQHASAPVSPSVPVVAPLKLKVAVSTLDVPTSDTALAGPASLVADLLTNAIASAGVDVVDRQAVRRWEADNRGAPNGNQALRDAANAAGVTTLVRGSLYRLGDSVLVQTQLVDARSGNVLRPLPLVQAPVEGQRRDVLAPLRDRMLGGLQLISAPELGPSALPATLPSLETAREITTGLELMAANDTARSLESLRHFERAVKLDSSLILPRVLLADDMRYLMDERRVLPPSQLPRLEAMYRALAARRDDMTDYEQALLDYGQAEMDGDPVRMLAARRRAADVAPGSLLARDLYAAMLRLNRPREALATLQRRGPELQPWMPGYEPGREDPAFWIAVSDIQHALGDHKASLAAAQRAYQLAPQSPRALAAELYAWAALGITDSLTNGIGRLLSLPATGEPGQNPANLAERAAGELDAFGHPEAAAKVRAQLLGWFEGRPPGVLEDENTLYQHALLLYHLKRYDQARPMLVALAARDSLYLSAQGLLARIDIRQQHAESADSLARRLERRATALGGRAEAAALFELALIEAVKGNVEKAINYLQGAFARGESWQVRQNLHWYPDLAPLREHPGFKQLTTPQG